MPDPKKPRSQQWRSQFRTRAHKEAHSENDHTSHHDTDHPNVPQGHAEWIDTNAGIRKLVDHLRAQGAFAYDSEFIGELTYHPRLCVLQFATASAIALVDPVADVDLQPIWEIFCDNAIRKIVHAGEQDLEPILRLCDDEPRNVFDTQVAAGFVGLSYPISLAKLVLEMTGARLGKGLTFTHWDQRPLTASQLRYAADDVRFLPAVHSTLVEKLTELGHLDYALKASAELCTSERHSFDVDSQSLRIRGAGSLSSTGLAVLRALCTWREQTAMRENVPARAVLRDEAMIDLARQPPKTIDKMQGMRMLPRPTVQAYGSAILKAVESALATPREKMPKPDRHEPGPTERFKADAIFALVSALSFGQSIDVSLVASRADVTDFVRILGDEKARQSHPLLQGWRRQAIGDRLMRILQDGSTVQVRWESNRLHLDR
jgi:ribonuclease D